VQGKLQIKGWQKVMKFSYMQTIKEKTFVIGTIVSVLIFATMISLANFLPVLLRDAPKTDEHGNIVAHKVKSVYIIDNSDINEEFMNLELLGIEYTLIEAQDFDETLERVTQSSQAVVLAVIDRTDYGFSVSMSRPESTAHINNSDCFALLNLFSAIISDANFMNLGIDESELQSAYSSVYTSVNVSGEEPRSEVATMIITMMTYLVGVFLFIMIVSYGSLTAQAIATEKSSRVMELILTSVQPLAIVVGKVFASVLIVLTSMAVFSLTSGIVFFATAPFGALGEVSGMVETTDAEMQAVTNELGGTFVNLTFGNVLLILFIFILGFLFFSLISALIGATVSKIEDLQTAMQNLSLIASLGYFLTVFAPLFELDVDGRAAFLRTLSWYLPISSPFAIPPAILTGDISAGEIALAIGVLLVCLVAFAIFVAKVYEHIILHNGDRVKFKDMVNMIKKNKP